jgi:hypothetical protein
VKAALLKVGLSLWVSITLLLGMSWWNSHQLNQELRTQIDLLRQVRARESQLSDSVYSVNQACSTVVVGLVHRLGIDIDTDLLTSIVGLRSAIDFKENEETPGMGGGP